METYLTVPQVAAMLHLSRSKMYSLVQKKSIPHIRIGRNVRIKESELVEWLKHHAIMLRTY